MSSPSQLNTVDPIALRYLMTETVFSVGGEATNAAGGPLPEPAEAEPAHIPEPNPQFSFCGGNKRNYLFLTQEKQYEWMSGTAMDAFVKTLAALKLAIDDVAILNLAKLAESPSVEQLSIFFNPKVVVNLGTPFTWPEQEGLAIFHAYTFDDMLVDVEKKRAFWTTIKTLLI